MFAVEAIALAASAGLLAAGHPVDAATDGGEPASARPGAGATPAAPAPSRGETPAVNPDDGLPWLDGLRRAAGDQPVFLVRGSDGMIYGRSLDGKVRRDLVRSQAPAPLLDGGLDLIWLREGGNVAVVDLRAKAPKRIAIARAVPTDAALKVQRMAGDDVVTLARNDVCSNEFISIAWYLLRVERYLTDGEEDLETSAKLTGKGWLKANQHREGPTEPASLTPWDDGAASTVALPGVKTKCADGADCKRSIDFGAKGWQLVVAGAAPKKENAAQCFSYSCLLHDPKTNTFASPEDPSKWGPASQVTLASPCGPFLFDASGKRYLTRTRLCDFDHGCREIGGESIGWLPFGPRVEVGY